MQFVTLIYLRVICMAMSFTVLRLKAEIVTSTSRDPDSYRGELGKKFHNFGIGFDKIVCDSV